MTDRLVVERLIAARPETVFRFFTSSDRWLQWQGTEAEIDARPGGVFRVNVLGDGFASGRFLEVDAPRRLVFTWGWESDGHAVPPGSSTVSIELEETGTSTLLRLEHRGLPNAPMVELHLRGWDMMVPRLASVAEAASDT